MQRKCLSSKGSWRLQSWSSTLARCPQYSSPKSAADSVFVRQQVKTNKDQFSRLAQYISQLVTAIIRQQNTANDDVPSDMEQSIKDLSEQVEFTSLQ